VSAAVQLVALQVVPVAVDADLDEVPRELLMRHFEAPQLLLGGDATAVRLTERVAVHVGHEPEALVAAHRAVAGKRFTDVTAGSQQLGMRVAHVGAIPAPGAEIPQHGPAGKRVVDVAPHGGECRQARAAVMCHCLTGRRTRGILPFDISDRYIETYLFIIRFATLVRENPACWSSPS